jgi:prophage regulatory protein
MDQQTRLLRIREVEALVGLKQSAIYKYMSQGQFPRPVVLGRRSVRWRSSDVQQWIDERRAAAAA